MQFVVPQFIDIEPKIIGSITPRQFIILIVGGGLIFAAYKLSDFSLFIIEGPVLLAISGTFAFLRINGQPIHFFVLNVFQSFKRPMLRVWRKDFLAAKEPKVKEKAAAIPVVTPRKSLPTTHLSAISLLVDTGGMYREE